jgi:TolB-like protein/Flp pilus assembly protein TadD
VHRDLKPGNLMLVEAAPSPLSSSNDNATRTSHQPRKSATEASRPQVKVIDFGVAKAVTDKTNPMALTHGGFVGTPAFASPEQFTNAPVDVRSDIYSLGATLWFLLTGRMLFSGQTIEEIQDARESKPLPINQLEAAHVPRRFISLLTSMLAIEPAARPAGARELARKLQAIRASITGRGRTAARVALAAAIVVLAAMVAVRVFHSSATKATPSTIPEKSIAVLPFENLSADPDNAYFAEGIQEEVLTRLASIGELKVISRASTQRYQSKPRNLSQIAKQLGVANILEGSVQKAGDQVRVNVQLINAETDAHLWADTYDRKLTDILLVESEIAKGIAESLQAKLTGREKQALAAQPTNNPEAYDAYLRGMAFEARNYGSVWSDDVAGKAAGFFEQAVQLDPNFAIAWARLSRAQAWIYSITSSGGDASKRALDNAQKLAPNSPETLLALGSYQNRVLRDLGLAKSTFDRVSKMLPANSEALLALSQVTRKQEHWDESIAYSERALALDPRNVQLLMDAAITYVQLREFPTALKLCDRVLDITPTDPDVMASKARIYHAQGNLQEAARLLSEINWQTPNGNTFETKITHLTLERNYSEAIRLLQTRQAQFHFDSEYNKATNQVRLALAQRLAGDAVGARVTAQQARNILEQLHKEQPNDPYLAMTLSQVYAVMGEKDLSLKVAERVLMTKAPLFARMVQEHLAMIQTMVGENSRAISILTELLQKPYWSYRHGPPAITSVLLRLDPHWDPLRVDPAFQKLCDEKQDLTTNGH